MKLITLTIILFFKVQTIFGQELLFNEKSVDTIEIISHLSAYKFDDEGTTKGKVEIMIITKSEDKKKYQISEYRVEDFSYSSKLDKEEVQKKWRRKYQNRKVDYLKLNKLINSLNKNESGEITFSNLSEDEFERFVNKKRIKKIARKNDLIWKFRPYYSTRKMNRNFFQGCQSVDTFKVFLTENYQIEENSGYVMITDFASVIEIHLKCKEKNFRFQGKYPNPLRQPWYNLTDWESIEMKSISNLNINLNLYELLPKNFLNRESISTQKLMDDYILWYFKRREMDF